MPTFPNGSTENAIALAMVVLANWFLAHLATDWVMPSEVQSSLQGLLVVAIGCWLRLRHMSLTGGGGGVPSPPTTDATAASNSGVQK